jgi:hypothetical protein
VRVSPSSVTDFFKKEFDGHGKYQALCRRSTSELAAALKLLNGEFSPQLLYGSRPRGDGTDDE